MSEIKNKDRILEAIDQLRRRKARPDIDRICNFLMRRFSVNGKETIADLSRMVDAEIVIKVEYKGNTSYRNAAKWSRLSGYKNKESLSENNNVSEARSLLSRAFASLLVDDPDYLDFGVPENELKRFLLEEEPCSEWTDLDAVFQREINSGFLVKLENGNYSLADHPVPSRKTNGESNSSDVKVFKFESTSSQFNTDSESVRVENHHIQNSVKSVSVNNTADVNNRKSASDTEDKKDRTADTPVSTTTATGAINIGGFRVGVRRKRAKKVFDPSDNNIPTRKRGRPVGSTNKSKETAQNNIKSDSSAVECSICHHGNNRRGQYERLISCRNCNSKAHPSCSDVGEKTDAWQCPNCRICAHCYQHIQLEPSATCSGCRGHYHLSCHTPRVPDKSKNNGAWLCFRCGPPPKQKPNSQVGNCSNMVIDSSTLSSPTSPRSPVPDATPACYPSSVHSVESDDHVDDSIPDVKGWTEQQVFMYLEEQGCSEQAEAFLRNCIDGDALLLLRRQDVLHGMGLKLGPALKVYRHVQRLQIRRSEAHLFWA
ncbi:histone acetyltransferase KAT6B [Anabrus simplex]|uniref:histone acetyltransferase KAT6B n=1 Tax=Anabrus simplex TaxID=316456 RepID=UPI0035A26EAF